MSDHRDAQRKFFEHLKMHPGAHRAAQHFATKIVQRDPTAIAALKDLAARAGSDERAANALRIVAVTLRFEKPTGSIIAGGIPASTGKIIGLVLTPAAWALSHTGKFFHWTGAQLQHLSHAI